MVLMHRTMVVLPRTMVVIPCAVVLYLRTMVVMHGTVVLLRVLWDHALYCACDDDALYHGPGAKSASVLYELHFVAGKSKTGPHRKGSG